MMTRKTKSLVTLIVMMVVLLIVVLTSLGIVYLKTDMLKSKSSLFAKYLTDGLVQTIDIINTDEEKNYNTVKQSSNFEANTDITGYYIKNYETVSEDTTDLVNNLELTIAEQNNNDLDKNHKTIELTNNTDSVSKIELYKNEETYGIKFSDLFSQILSVDNSNLTQLAQKLGMDSTNIPDAIDFTFNYEELLDFSDEEIMLLKNKYIDSVIEDISKEKFSKQSNAVITVNNTSATTNVYTLTLTQEEINNIYIGILQKLENDEIILNKLANVDSKIYEIYSSDEYASYVTDNFKSKVESEIENIQNNNIGQNQIKISIYEQNRKTVRIKEETDAETKTIDFVKTDALNQVTCQTTKVENTNRGIQVVVKKEKNNGDCKFLASYIDSTSEDGIKNEIDFSRNLTNVENKSFVTNTQISYLYDTNKIGININKTLNVLDNITESGTNEENIVLNTLDADTLNSLLEQVQAAMTTHTTDALTKFQQQYETSIINPTNFLFSNIIIEDNQISSSEINRFNTKFEFYTGDEVDYDIVNDLMDVVSENLDNIEVISNSQIKLVIKEGKENKELANSILNVLNSDKKYSVKIDYNENNLIEDIILTIL